MEQALQVAAKRRKSTQNKSGANPSMIYPKDAAIQAIRRFSARPPFPEMLVGGATVFSVRMNFIIFGGG